MMPTFTWQSPLALGFAINYVAAAICQTVTATSSCFYFVAIVGCYVSVAAVGGLNWNCLHVWLTARHEFEPHAC